MPQELDDMLVHVASIAKDNNVIMQVRGGLVFNAHRWLFHSTLGSRVMKKEQMRPSPSHLLADIRQ